MSTPPPSSSSSSSSCIEKSKPFYLAFSLVTLTDVNELCSACMFVYCILDMFCGDLNVYIFLFHLPRGLVSRARVHFQFVRIYLLKSKRQNLFTEREREREICFAIISIQSLIDGDGVRLFLLLSHINTLSSSIEDYRIQ